MPTNPRQQAARSVRSMRGGGLGPGASQAPKSPYQQQPKDVNLGPGRAGGDSTTYFPTPPKPDQFQDYGGWRDMPPPRPGGGGFGGGDWRDMPPPRPGGGGFGGGGGMPARPAGYFGGGPQGLAMRQVYQQRRANPMQQMQMQQAQKRMQQMAMMRMLSQQQQGMMGGGYF